jgi:uncharacterized Fe-S cluster protein YjdI
MMCFKCDNEIDFEIQEREILQEYKGIEVKILTQVTVCKHCGNILLNNGQTNELIKRCKYQFGLIAPK